jgi:hypothetical protein
VDGDANDLNRHKLIRMPSGPTKAYIHNLTLRMLFLLGEVD